MSLQALLVIIIIAFMIVALAKDMLRPGLVFYSAVTFLLLIGVINTKEALSGFSNEGMITIALLFLVSEGVKKTGALNYLALLMLPRKKVPLPRLLLKTMLPIASLSAFLNNTPIVIIFAPMVKHWAEKFNLPVSKFLIPLSYASILGGMCTLIGTSTNLVVHGMMLDAGYSGIGMFEIGKIGLPIALVGFLYLNVFGNLLLPGKKVLRNNVYTGHREYFFDVYIPSGSPLIGKRIFHRKSPKLKNFLVTSIQRNGKTIQTSNSEYIIEANDYLVLSGTSNNLKHLMDISGLQLACLQNVQREFTHNKNLIQIEVVLAPRFRGIGETLNEFDFISHYNAVVMAVYRHGERITSNVAGLKLKDGDTLILITTEQFLKDWGESRVFYTTSYLGDIRKPEKKKQMWLSLAIVGFMVISAAVFRKFYLSGKELFDMYLYASVALVFMVWTKILPAKDYTKSIRWDVLITIACAFAVSKALANSGAADGIASLTVNSFHRYGAIGVLAGIYLMTNLFTELITNNAAAAFVFPIAHAAALKLGVDPKPFFIAITIAASASFSTPIGYQTNLIIQGMGNYRFVDYVKIGLPLNILCFIVSILLIPLLFPF